MNDHATTTGLPLAGASVLILGADGGIGAALVRACARRGAARIHAGGLNAAALDALRGVAATVSTAIVDVTDAAAVQAHAAASPSVDVVINSFGVERKVPYLHERSLAAARLEMEVNYFGVLNVAHAFVPRLIGRRSAFVTLLSMASRIAIVPLGGYCAAKAAAHQLTVLLRSQAAGTGLRVHGVYPAWVDTAMAAGVAVAKAGPDDVAEAILRGVEQGIDDIYPDERSARLFADRAPTPVFTGFGA